MAAKGVKKIETIILPSEGFTHVSTTAGHMYPLMSMTGKYFLRGRGVSEVITDGKGYSLAPVTANGLMTRIENLGVPVRRLKMKDGAVKATLSNLKDMEAKALLEAREIELLPPIKGLASCPVMTADAEGGCRIAESGYDSGTGVFVTCKDRLPQLPTVEEARAMLLELLADFNFQTPADKSRAVALLLTPAMILGQFTRSLTPMFMVEANASQTGKGYLLDLIAAIYNQALSMITQHSGRGVPTAGAYNPIITAANGVQTNATEYFVLTVNETHGVVTNLAGTYWYLGPPAFGNDWHIYREVPGSVPTAVDGAAARIGLASDGTVLVENSSGGVYARIGSTNGIGSYWKILTSVTAGDGATWFLGSDGVGSDSYIYRWAAGGSPTYSGGYATQISTLTDGSILVRNNAGNYYLRMGSNAGLGSAWQQVFIAGTAPMITNPAWLGNGTFRFRFTNQSSASFRVFSSTNVALPLAQWTSLGAPVESPAGNYQFTDPQVTNRPQRFYRVTSP